MARRILLLVERSGNRRLLADELSAEHTVIGTEPERLAEDHVDLVVIDDAALGRHSDALRARKQRERPLHLPVLLVTTAETVRRVPDVQPAFDDVLVAPTERSVLRTRVDRLLLTRRMSEDLLRRAQEAERAARLRDEVLAIVAHDLRNPLGTIAGSADLLHMPLPPDKREQHITMIQRTADRMNRLIGDLLDAAKIEAGRLKLELNTIDAAELVAEVVELEGTRAEGKDVDLSHQVSTDVPPVRGDRNQLLRVLTNLLGNAIKFTPSGGRVEVRAARADGRVRFSISDSGPGIPQDQLPLLFRRFWQAKRADKAGAGLGLAIARGIVEAHGGEIWADSRVGEGSTFHFTVPAANGR